jgi:hypothetical protein
MSGAGWRILKDGLMVGESPRWHDDRLWFCHWGTGEIVALAMDGTSEVRARLPQASTALATIPFSIDWLRGVPSRHRGKGPPGRHAEQVAGIVAIAEAPAARAGRP